MDELAIQESSNSDLIRSRIFTIRGVQVILDKDLAELYGVEVSQLNRQVKRNIERFPDDFMFQLTREECSRCQIGILNGSRGSNIKYLPYAFTENGVAMLSGLLRSSRAIAANIQIMRAFNAQYANSLTVKVSDRFHDRFLIIDKTTLIHVGASLNHLGKKCFAFSSLDKSNIPDILRNLKISRRT